MSTVLICDSSAVTCHTVSKQLRTYGFDAISARSSAAACAALAAQPVDLIILDPAADAGGLSLLRELRRERGQQRTPVIILTSSARPGDRAQAHAAGAVAFLTKPVSTRELLLTVNTALAQGVAAVQPAPAAPSAAAQPVVAAPAPRLLPRRELRPEWVGPAVAAVGAAAAVVVAGGALL